MTTTPIVSWSQILQSFVDEGLLSKSDTTLPPMQLHAKLKVLQDDVGSFSRALHKAFGPMEVAASEGLNKAIFDFVLLTQLPFDAEDWREAVAKRYANDPRTALPERMRHLNAVPPAMSAPDWARWGRIRAVIETHGFVIDPKSKWDKPAIIDEEGVSREISVIEGDKLRFIYNGEEVTTSESVEDEWMILGALEFLGYHLFLLGSPCSMGILIGDDAMPNLAVDKQGRFFYFLVDPPGVDGELHLIGPVKGGKLKSAHRVSHLLAPLLVRAAIADHEAAAREGRVSLWPRPAGGGAGSPTVPRSGQLSWEDLSPEEQALFVDPDPKYLGDIRAQMAYLSDVKAVIDRLHDDAKHQLLLRIGRRLPQLVSSEMYNVVNPFYSLVIAREYLLHPDHPADTAYFADVEEALLCLFNLNLSDRRHFKELKDRLSPTLSLRGLDLSRPSPEEIRLVAHMSPGLDLSAQAARSAGIHHQLNDYDLSGLDLSETDLRRVSLGNANLRGTNLRNALLDDAYLSKALFDQDTDLSGASLRSTDLHNVSGLTARQLGTSICVEACVNDDSELAAIVQEQTRRELERPKTVEDLLEQFQRNQRLLKSDSVHKFTQYYAGWVGALKGLIEKVESGDPSALQALEAIMPTEAFVEYVNKTLTNILMEASGIPMLESQAKVLFIRFWSELQDRTRVKSQAARARRAFAYLDRRMAQLDEGEYHQAGLEIAAEIQRRFPLSPNLEALKGVNDLREEIWRRKSRIPSEEAIRNAQLAREAKEIVVRYAAALGRWELIVYLKNATGLNGPMAHRLLDAAEKYPGSRVSEVLRALEEKSVSVVPRQTSKKRKPPQKAVGSKPDSGQVDTAAKERPGKPPKKPTPPQHRPNPMDFPRGIGMKGDDVRYRHPDWTAARAEQRKSRPPLLRLVSGASGLVHGGVTLVGSQREDTEVNEGPRHPHTTKLTGRHNAIGHRPAGLLHIPPRSPVNTSLLRSMGR